MSFLRCHECHMPSPRPSTEPSHRSWALRLHWNTPKYGDNELRFPYMKEMLKKVSEIWASALKTFPQRCHSPKNVKVYRFEGRQITNLPGAPACLRPACLFHKIFLHLIRFMNFGAGHKLVISSPCKFLLRPTIEFVFSQIGRQQRAECYWYFPYQALQNIIKMTDRTRCTETPRRMLWPENQTQTKTKLTLKITLLWNLRLGSAVERHCTDCGSAVERHCTDVSQRPAPSHVIRDSSKLKAQAAISSEILVRIYECTRRHNPEDGMWSTFLSKAPRFPTVHCALRPLVLFSRVHTHRIRRLNR